MDNQRNIVATHVNEGLCCPLVAVLCSVGADELVGKNGLNFADLLAPFCTVDVSVKDPHGNKVRSKVTIDVRDLRRSGFLLSHTVLPHVLYENIAILSENLENSQKQPLFSHFASSFLYWFEPSDHDFLRRYICCLFVVSAHENNPMEEFEKLDKQQHVHKSSSYNSSTSFSPAYCSSPRWMPDILRYYVLLEDISLGNRDRTNEIYRAVAEKYGSAFCHLLCINSVVFSDMPDLWLEILERRYRGLQSGLESAHYNVVNKSGTTSRGIRHKSNRMKLLSSVPLGYPRSVFALTCQVGNFSPLGLGRCLDTFDRERICTFVSNFVQNALVPFMEWQLKHHYEGLVARRHSFGRSLGGLSKWIGAIALTTVKDSSKVYESDSYEYQQRRLADVSFQMGLFDFSLKVYQSLKRDFANNQSWLHYAGALEMAGFSSFLSAYLDSKLSLEDLREDYPRRYMHNAIDYYLNVCGQPMLATRCAILSAGILVELEMLIEATNQLVWLSSSPDLPAFFGSLLLDYAAFLSQKLGRKRKTVFYLVLAGHRFAEAGLKKYSQESFQKALPLFVSKGWEHAENHIFSALSSYNESLSFAKGHV